ncbi:MAG: hypothetical protein ABR949_14800 [Candidatus Aquilonibacter sp.]|jgi:hypothetical protein
MRRWLCVLQIGVLTLVLWPGIARASLADSFAPQSIDLSTQLFARLFGESSDRGAAETPLRDLALRVDDTTIATVNAPAIVAQLPVPSASLADASFAPPTSLRSTATSTASTIADLSAQLRVPSVEYYESAAPVATDAPATHRFDLSRLQAVAVPSPAFAQGVGANAPGEQSAGVKLPVRLGKLSFSPHAEAALTPNLQTNFNNAALGAGATINVRAGTRDVGVDLSSQLERATLGAPQFTTASASTTLNLAGDTLPVFVPAYADVSGRTLATGLTVPVTRSLTANLQFDTQHLLGTYSLPGASNLDANNTVYGAQLTYKIPRSTSAISFSASQYHFQDNLVPSNALTQTNANVNFTIKF